MSSIQLRELTCQQAHQMVRDNANAILVDIRSTVEFLFIGHPVGAQHVPWLDEPDWAINLNFTAEINHLIHQKDTTIILICRSGNRSKEAGIQLIDAGMENIYHINEGFEGDRDNNNHRGTLGGWRFHQLPWEQC